jgi:prepilin-type N-terminal cleavage/methylation domain-containing protein
MIRLSSEKGFTLIELVVALVGFSVLAMVIIPKIANASDQAKIAACKQNQQLITCACTFYYATHNSNSHSGKLSSFPDKLADLTPDYLEEIPQCPGGGHYIYGAVNGTVTCTELSHARY